MGTSHRLPKSPPSIQVVLDHQGIRRLVCKIGFSNRDSSFYVIRANVGGTYYYGHHQLGRDEITGTVVSTQGIADEDRLPKLSIHESARCMSVPESGAPVRSKYPPLSTLRGQHVASLTTDDMPRLPARAPANDHLQLGNRQDGDEAAHRMVIRDGSVHTGLPTHGTGRRNQQGESRG